MKKLSKKQREVLELLNAGHIMTIDRTNSSYIGDREIAFSTRNSLTRVRYITSLDKTKSIHTKGNGFTISKKGKAALNV